MVLPLLVVAGEDAAGVDAAWKPQPSFTAGVSPNTEAGGSPKTVGPPSLAAGPESPKIEGGPSLPKIAGGPPPKIEDLGLSLLSKTMPLCGRSTNGEADLPVADGCSWTNGDLGLSPYSAAKADVGRSKALSWAYNGDLGRSTYGDPGRSRLAFKEADCGAGGASHRWLWRCSSMAS